MSFEDKLNEIDRLLAQLRRDVKILPERPKLGFHAEDYPSGYFTPGHWDCEDSPTKSCMYTTDWDCCIFCGQPDERK